MIKDSRAYQYCLFALTEGNKKVPRYVKKQCQLWKDVADGNDEEAFIDDKAYTRIIKILKLMVHPDLLKPMDIGLSNHAMLLITATFCTKLKNDKQLDIRYYTTILEEIARKNFKTFDSAVIFILLMLTEPKFSRFFSVAPDLKLSKELQVAIKKIIKSSPLLCDDLEPVFKTLRSEIRCLLTESEYTPLAYSEDRMDGKLANAFLADEAGAMDSYPVEAMRSSQITLLNKLGIIISTQYPNDNNVMIDEVDKAKKTLDGLRENKRMFALLFEPDDELLTDDQWQSNDLIIYQSNPVAVENDYIFQAIKDMREDAIMYENKRENYLCKHNNIKYKGLGVEGYVEITKVRECKIEHNPSFWKGKKVFLGMDLSTSDDNTSIAMVTLHEGAIYAKVWGFIPGLRSEWKSKKEGVDYKKLVRQGVCFESDDEVIDYGQVEAFIMGDDAYGMQGLQTEYGVEIIQIGYDPHNATSTVQKLENKQFECVNIKQHSSVLHPATKLLKERVTSKKDNFFYEENLMLEINFQNARCTYDTNLNQYVNKKKSVGKVDMVVSLINAICLLKIHLLDGHSDFVVQTG